MKRRTNITIHPEIYRKAEVLMGAMDFGDFSSFLEHLIRAEYERRHGPIAVPGRYSELPDTGVHLNEPKQR